MTQAKTKISVKFLYNRRNNDLFAVFTYEVYGDKNMRIIYSHIGQHSGCHIDYVRESEPASEYLYFSLAKELESIGYELEVTR